MHAFLTICSYPGPVRTPYDGNLTMQPLTFFGTPSEFTMEADGNTLASSKAHDHRVWEWNPALVRFLHDQWMARFLQAFPVPNPPGWKTIFKEILS